MADSPICPLVSAFLGIQRYARDRDPQDAVQISIEIVVSLMLGCTFSCIFFLVGVVHAFTQCSDVLCLTCVRQCIGRQPKGGVNCQPRVSPKHQQIGGITDWAMEGRVVRVYQRWYMGLPVALLILLQRAEHLEQRLIKPLSLAIPHQVLEFPVPAILQNSSISFASKLDTCSLAGNP